MNLFLLNRIEIQTDDLLLRAFSAECILTIKIAVLRDKIKQTIPI